MTSSSLIGCLLVGAGILACRGETGGVGTSCHPVSVSIAPATPAFTYLGQAQQLSAEAIQNGAPTGCASIVWSSTDTAVLKVSSTGLATATAVGSAIIRATATTATGELPIQVTQVQSTISVLPQSTTVDALGKTVQLQATVRDAGGNVIPGATVAWSSTDATVLTVSSTGLATANKNGSTAVHAASGAAAAQAQIVVNQVTARLIAVEDAIGIAIGEKVVLTATAFDANDHPIPDAILWMSLAPDVATVSASGEVTGHATGKATIRATAHNKTVEVEANVFSADVAQARASLADPLTIALLGDISSGVAQVLLVSLDDAKRQITRGQLSTARQILAGARDQANALGGADLEVAQALVLILEIAIGQLPAT